MRKSTKFLAAVAFAGLAAAGGSAFTGSGLSTSGSAAADQFVGGTVSQSVTGATLSSVAYSYADTSNTAIHSALLTFADANSDGKSVGIVFSGGNAAAFTCTAVEATNHTSTCTATTADETGVTSAAITVS
jgi:hypothetical protein